MAKTKPSKKDLDSCTIKSINKVVRAGMRPSDSDKPSYVACVEKIDADHWNNVKLEIASHDVGFTFFWVHLFPKHIVRNFSVNPSASSSSVSLTWFLRKISRGSKCSKVTMKRYSCSLHFPWEIEERVKKMATRCDGCRLRKDLDLDEFNYRECKGVFTWLVIINWLRRSTKRYPVVRLFSHFMLNLLEMKMDFGLEAPLIKQAV
ncbi:hypothetical protein PTKIN_Ptkin01aG0329800 [Pterospermum kingtungense]